MPVVYKMTSAVSGDLDDLLEKKGYPVVKYVDVLYRSLEDWNGNLWTDLGQDYEIITMSWMDEEWLDGVNQLIDIPWKRCRKRFSAGSVCRWSV